MGTQQSGVQSRKTSGLIKLFILIGFLAAVIITVRATGLHTYLDQQKLQQWIAGYGALGPCNIHLGLSCGSGPFFAGAADHHCGRCSLWSTLGRRLFHYRCYRRSMYRLFVARYLGREWVGNK